MSVLESKYVVFDFEWDKEGNITCSAFVDYKNRKKVIHVSEFDSRDKFLEEITSTILQYECSLGWYSTGDNSDLVKLHENCNNAGVENIVKIPIKGNGQGGGLPIIFDPGSMYDNEKLHIDLWHIFSKPMVRSIFKNVYKSTKLHDVATALLGRGKTADNSKLENLSIEQLKFYCLNDTEITALLFLHKDGQIIKLMHAISELVGMPIEKVCHSGISIIWARIYDSITPRPERTARFEKQTFDGGFVYDPKPGIYENVFSVDAASLYPTVAINYNLSFDTVNCNCCIDDESAYVRFDIIPEVMWICQKRTGYFPQKLKYFRQERLKYKRLQGEDNQIKAQGLKIIINGGYGVFANPNFKYGHLATAKLIPAFGRFVLRTMKKYAEEQGFTVIGGDTDSLFLQGKFENLPFFIAKCKESLSVEVEHQSTFSKFIVGGKKHYFGITDNNEIIVKGFEGKKDDRPEWIRDTFYQFVHDYCYGLDYMLLLKASYDMFLCDQIPLEKLRYSIQLSKNPNEYSEKNGLAKTLSIMSGAKKDDVIYYFKTHKPKRKSKRKSQNNKVETNTLENYIKCEKQQAEKTGYALEVSKHDELDLAEYRKTFENTFSEILKLAGHDISEVTCGLKQIILQSSHWSE